MSVLVTYFRIMYSIPHNFTAHLVVPLVNQDYPS